MYGSASLVRRLVLTPLDIHQEYTFLSLGPPDHQGTTRDGQPSPYEEGPWENPMELAIRMDKIHHMEAMLPYFCADRSEWKRTPLHMACKYRAMACFNRLAQDRAYIPSPTTRDKEGFTPIHHAASGDNHMLQVVLGLHARDVSLDVMFPQTEQIVATPLKKALEADFDFDNPDSYHVLENLNLLIKAGADVARMDISSTCTYLIFYLEIAKAYALKAMELKAIKPEALIVLESKVLLIVDTLLRNGGGGTKTAVHNPVQQLLQHLTSIPFAQTQPRRFDIKVHTAVVETYTSIIRKMISLCYKYGISFSYYDTRDNNFPCPEDIVTGMLFYRPTTHWNVFYTGGDQTELPQPFFPTNPKLFETVLSLYTETILMDFPPYGRGNLTNLLHMVIAEPVLLPFAKIFVDTLGHQEWLVVRETVTLFVAGVDGGSDTKANVMELISFPRLTRLSRQIIHRCMTPLIELEVGVCELGLPQSLQDYVSCKHVR